MKNYEETIENVLITFESMRARYIFACETLLAPLILPQVQYVELIYNPDTKTWNDQDLQDALKDRLGPATSPYLGLVQKVHRYSTACVCFARSNGRIKTYGKEIHTPSSASLGHCSSLLARWKLKLSRIWRYAHSQHVNISLMENSPDCSDHRHLLKARLRTRQVRTSLYNQVEFGQEFE